MNGYSRIPALDALRGILAAIVVLNHTLLAFGSDRMGLIGLVSVLAFFTMSSFVLCRAYDGRPGLFMVRRVVRLWPLYAVCILAGHALRSGPFDPLELVWSPSAFPWVDPPAWSLCYEVWFTPILPLLFWVTGRWRWMGWPLAAVSALMVHFSPGGLFLAFFILGATLARYRVRFPTDLSAWSLWLGKVSFSLYLTHQLVLTAAVGLIGPWGAVVVLPLVPVVAWVAWRTIEAPSARLSRRVDYAQAYLARAFASHVLRVSIVEPAEYTP